MHLFRDKHMHLYTAKFLVQNSEFWSWSSTSKIIQSTPKIVTLTQFKLSKGFKDEHTVYVAKQERRYQLTRVKGENLILPPTGEKKVDELQIIQIKVLLPLPTYVKPITFSMTKIGFSNPRFPFCQVKVHQSKILRLFLQTCLQILIVLNIRCSIPFRFPFLFLSQKWAEIISCDLVKRLGW